MPRIRTLAPLALTLPIALGGCYRYDMRATNTAGQDVRVSLHKGRRHREISTVVLAPGASVGWTGQSQRPLILRFATEPGAALTREVIVPRRTHTEFDIAAAGGGLDVLNSQTGEPVGLPDAPAETPPAADPQHQHDDDLDQTDEPAIDLVEPDDD